jgi:hypothetical protein
MSDRPYSRVYWEIVDDPKFETIYDNDSHLAAWLRMLLMADQAHPASGQIPSNARRASVKALANAGLIDVAGGRFRVHGLAAERSRRSEAGRVGGLASGRSRAVERPLNVPLNDGRTKTNLDEDETRTRQDETSIAHDGWDEPEAEAVTWLAKHGCSLMPHSGYYRHLVLMVEAHGINAVIGMFDRLAGAGTKSGDIKGYLFAARDALDKRTRPNLANLEKEDRAEEIERTSQREVERTKRYLAELRAVGGGS